jgi:alpha-beta hydrolase superfamily lysophospholipase
MKHTSSSIIRHEGHFNGHNGLELFFQSWSAANGDPKPRGTLVITHGQGEHSDCYNHTAESLVKMGWNVYSWDLRGHGRSQGKRGYVGDFNDYCLDLGYLLRHLKATGKLDQPFALIGHSMGGLITLRHLLDEERHTPVPIAFSLSSPLLGVALKVPAVKDAAARVLNRLLPSVTLYNEIKYENLTRDPEFLQKYPSDNLRHDKISSGVYLGFMAAIEYVNHHADRLRIPVLVQVAGSDKIVSAQATKDFFPLIGAEDKKLIVYDDCYHEIFNDLEREKVLQDLVEFLREKFPAQK